MLAVEEHYSKPFIALIVGHDQMILIVVMSRLRRLDVEHIIDLFPPELHTHQELPGCQSFVLG